MCACFCVRGREREMKTGWINTRPGSAWRMSATRTWTQRSAAIGGRLARPQPLPELHLDKYIMKTARKSAAIVNEWPPQTLTTTRSILIKMPVSGFPNNTVQQLFNYWIHNVPYKNTIIYRLGSISLSVFLFFKKFTSLVGFYFHFHVFIHFIKVFCISRSHIHTYFFFMNKSQTYHKYNCFSFPKLCTGNEPLCDFTKGARTSAMWTFKTTRNVKICIASDSSSYYNYNKILFSLYVIITDCWCKK